MANRAATMIGNFLMDLGMAGFAIIGFKSYIANDITIAVLVGVLFLIISISRSLQEIRILNEAKGNE